MSQDIRHDGVIHSIDGHHIRVRILQTSACAACKIAGHCSASETKEKLVDVTASPAGFSVGQRVVVSTSGSVARRALLLGFGLPLVLLLTVLVATIALGADEPTAGVAALLSLMPYYAVLWLCRGRIERSVSFGLTVKE